LIPADPETWSVRRRQIVPAFHKAWLEHMVGLFGYCNEPLIESLNKVAEGDGKAEMETFFCSVALDIIGLSVFNYKFGSVTNESPVIKAVYSALVEAEHRSMTPAPYWNLPLANQLVPRLRKFNGDLKLLNDVLNTLITRAKDTRQVEDIEELENRNYAQVQDPSMLRFLVDMRGADIDNKQLRDDVRHSLRCVCDSTGVRRRKTVLFSSHSFFISRFASALSLFMHHSQLMTMLIGESSVFEFFKVSWHHLYSF
jgi:hypothetical protein